MILLGINRREESRRWSGSAQPDQSHWNADSSFLLSRKSLRFYNSLGFALARFYNRTATTIALQQCGLCASTAKTEKTQKSKAPAFADAFDWDGMGGNIGGLSVFVLALVIRYLLLV